MEISDAVISGLGILGTLGGTLLGYRSALKTVQMQLDHADRIASRSDGWTLSEALCRDRATQGHNAPKELDRSERFHEIEWTECLGEFNATYGTRCLTRGPPHAAAAAGVPGDCGAYR